MLMPSDMLFRYCLRFTIAPARSYSDRRHDAERAQDERELIFTQHHDDDYHSARRRASVILKKRYQKRLLISIYYYVDYANASARA